MSYIKKIYIENFKGYKKLDLNLNPGMNIIVGDNDSKKTTILEAVNLVLSGNIDGKYLAVENLNDFLFNKEIVDEYLKAMSEGKKDLPPSILIELFFSDDMSDDFEGAENHSPQSAKGIYLKISLKQDYEEDYLKLNEEDLRSLPLELYDIELKRFSGTEQVRKLLAIKNSFIDTSSNFQNASDQTIARIIKK